MDLSQAPAVGGVVGLGILVLVIFYLLGSNRADRDQHLATLKARDEAHAAEQKACDERIDKLGQRLAVVEARVDKEQELRRQALDKSATADRRAAAAEAKADTLQKLLETRGLR